VSVVPLDSLEITMKKSMLALSIALLLIASFSYAQVNTSELSNAEGLTKQVYGLGLSAGLASGVGLSFRSHLPSNVSAQGIFGIIKTSDRLSMSIGGELQYDLVRNNAIRFFAGSALSYFYDGQNRNEVSAPYRFGAGIGGEFYVQGGLHVTVEGMFTIFSDGRIIPLPQIAAHYYFF
jgi:hypothetical protein